MDIRERIEILKREEYTLNKKLEKYILKIQKDFLKEENWFIHNKKEVNILINQKLIIDYSGKSHYISFLEKNINFSKISTELEVNSIDKYNFNFKGKNLFKGNIRIFIIEYSKQGEKLRLNSYPLNTEKKLKFNEDTSYIRFAIRTEGTGTSVIESLTFEAGEKKKEELFYIPTKSKEPKKIKDLNVIFIGDEFTTRSFDPEFNTIKVSPENWKEEITGIDIDFFFCESAWQGNDGKWTNKVGFGGPRDNTTLLELLSWCKFNEIKTVFWNKEDPVHYNAFIETAKHFDYVFTTDVNSIKKYKEFGCKEVYALPFAAQLKHHNPIEKFERKNKIVFAGSYYGEKFPKRTKIMEEMLGISEEFGLDIYDRNYKNPNDANQFPEHFKKEIIGDLKGDEIDIAYKGYRLSINVNSVTESPTMFARRVFELLACNTPIISSGSIGITEMFNGLVLASQDKEKLQKQLKKYFSDEEFYRKNRLETLREVLEKHTYTNRVEKILDRVKYPYIKEKESITVICVIKNMEEYEKMKNLLENQTYESFKTIFFIDIFDGYLDIFNSNNTTTTKTYLLDYIHHYRSIKDMIDTDYILPLSLETNYGKNYIKDMILSTKYLEKDVIITKNISEKEYTFITYGKLLNSLIPLDYFKIESPLDFIKKYENNFNFSELFAYGAKIFNIDNYNIENKNVEKVRIDHKKLKRRKK